jgi:hypothetical protein
MANDAGFGAGFGYSGVVVHYGPVITEGGGF